jgi:hypothetical protein
LEYIPDEYFWWTVEGMIHVKGKDGFPTGAIVNVIKKGLCGMGS